MTEPTGPTTSAPRDNAKTDMPKPQLAQDDASIAATIDQIAFYRDLTSAKDMSDFMTRILGVVNRLGFSDYSFARLALKEDVERPVTTLPEEMPKNYREEAFYEHDMLLDYVAGGNTAPLFQSQIGKSIDQAPFLTETYKRNRDILNFNWSFGYNDSYLIPMHAHNGGGPVLFSITSKDMKIEEFQRRTNLCKPVLHLLGEAVDYIGTTKFPRFFLGHADQRDIVITPRPLLLLSALAREDLTLKEAADKLGISIDTANKHIAAAKRALGVNTQAAAIYGAIKEGLINVESD
ncbi:hypothetical protein FKG94_24515 [Exilibacterium tricleocarpae]|uniref:HTH luxR-type domain-containing protein n=1 Tax=Exilibacterium tricleocarpae TaxID=2591008 RepID=A0A545SSP9_9GAMM|nr:autoinducer binding domain-containing protein [Exilibacterium tricleocarpae]TQV68001.1 hypothetical protein FKG94_24515 [Exilibacterium tricleocarpae]